MSTESVRAFMLEQSHEIERLTAALATARRDALESAAKRIDRVYPDDMNPNKAVTDAIACIRALMMTPGDGT